MDREDLLNKLKKFKHLNGQKYGIEALGLFGSFARDQAKESSDVDIVVKIQTPDPYTIVHIKEELESQLSMPVDIIRLREQMNPFLKERISNEVIYVR